MKAYDQTIDQIVEILTPEQKSIWQTLVGKRFPYNLGYRPDDWSPK
jgi:hypothetical protein